MADPINELFTAALGISAPWKVAEVRFELEAHLNNLLAFSADD